MSLVYYTYLATTEGAYRTEPEPRPTPAAPPPPPSPSPPPQRPSPKPAPNPTTTDSATIEALPPAVKSTRKDPSTTTIAAGSLRTHGDSENESTTTTTTTSTTTTTKDDGGGGATAGGGSSPTLPLSPERTTSDGGSSPEPTGVQPPSSPPGAQPTNGGITLQPGSTMVFRNPSGVSSTPAPAISGSVISAPMTGVVFTFAFLGAVIIGLVAGFFIAKHTRLGGGGGGGGGGRSRIQQRDELTDQVRLLIDTIGQRNSRNFDNGPQKPYRHDRSYLDDEKFAHASVTHQGERMPLYTNGRQSVASTFTAAHGGDDSETERLHPHPIPDQNQYQEWNLVNSHLISPHSNNVPPHPMSFSHHSTMVSPLTGPPTTNTASRPESSGAGTFLSPRVVHLPPTQLPPDVEIYGPNGEWGSLSDIRGGGGGGGGGRNASRTSVADLSEFERRRPQIQEEGEGEDSLFNIEHPRHNPHVTAIME